MKSQGRTSKWTRLKSVVPEPVKKPLRRWLKPPSESAAGIVRGSRPKMISLELTNECNLNCPFCLVGLQNTLPSTEHDLLPRGLGFMEWKLFEKIVGDAVDFGIKRLQLHFQGESLLHKKFPEMVRHAKERGLQTQVFTNGLVLTRQTAEKILKSGLDLMRFSVDGVSEEVYQKNRVGGKFERVYRNMAMLAEMVRADGSPLRLEWQMIALRNNEHEIPEARKLAEKIGIPFFVKTYAVTDPGLVTLDPAYHRRMHLKPCLDIYRSMFVYWNGGVVMCCYDQKGDHMVGNLEKNSLSEIWEGHIYADLRRRIDDAAVHPENEPAMCKTCLKWSHDPWKTSDGKTVWGVKEAPPSGKTGFNAVEEDLV